MATFKGNLEEFVKYIGPLSRNIVCNLSRKYKKHKTCQHEGCNKTKPLEAAHIKGNERPKIIADILIDFQMEDNLFIIDLEAFQSKFIDAHTPIGDAIILLCRQHHLEYDRVNNIPSEYPVIVDQFEDENGIEQYSVEEMMKLENVEIAAIGNNLIGAPISQIKEEVSKRFSINKSQICFARVSTNGLWNFDVKIHRFTNELYFVFYNQNKQSYAVAQIGANSMDITNLPLKDADTIRLFIDSEYNDRSAFSFREYILN